MGSELTIQPEVRNTLGDALIGQPPTPADWSNALHLIYGEIQALRITVGGLALLIDRLEFSPSFADWAQKSLIVADNLLPRALAIEHIAISSAVKIHRRYSCSVDDAIAPFMKITETALIISISAFTQANEFSYLHDDDKASRVVADRFVNIAKTATCIAEIACADIAALQKGVMRVRWLAHLNSPTAGHFQGA